MDKKSSLLTKGFATSFAYNFTSLLGLEAAFRYNDGYIARGDWKISDTERKMGVKRTDIALLVGPRLTFGRGRVSPFVHALVGLSHDRLSWANDATSEDRNTDSESKAFKTGNSFGIAAGGGLDISINENVAIRAIQADYYMANHTNLLDPHMEDHIYNRNNNYDGSKRFNDVNLSFGIVYRFGN
jgi:opacity protein-like surface antigen